jgi:hypothetical protein
MTFTALFGIYILKLIQVLTRSADIKEQLEVKFGSVYSDLDYKENNNSSVMPILFIFKRIVFTLLCMYNLQKDSTVLM